MPKGRFSTLVSWSFSVYAQYLKCPFSVCLDKIMRIKIEEPPNPHFEKGNRIHESADVFIGGMGRKKLEPELEKLKPLLDGLRTAKARTEQEWAFTRDWNPTAWFAKDAWLRIKTDVCVDRQDPPEVDIIDWKTGKLYEDHKQQRSLYALGGLQLVQIGALAGGSKEVKLTAQHIYIDTGQRATESFVMKNLASLKREWLARIKFMMSDTQFKTHTGFHCRYCKFRKSAGGPCPEKM
jgi:PD-(D/E)XK nuclease superfamily